MDGMAAAGTMEKNDRRTLMGSLVKAAECHQPKPAAPEPAAPVVKIDPAETAAQLAAWGIGYGPE